MRRPAKKLKMRHISSALWWVLPCNSVLNPFLHTLNVVQRLLTVAMSDLVCCFLFRLPGVLASSGTPISGEVNVAMAIFLLLFSSAHNPFLYTLNVARRLLTVAICDNLCWFPIGLPGLMASSGTPISGEVNVAMAIFLLLFSSAHNPFLYTLNAVMQKYSGGIDFLATEFDYFCFAFQYV